MTRYNGHKNWNHWNVSLWLFNDEGLYRTLYQLNRWLSTKDEAARQMLAHLRFAQNASNPTTPDGAPYTVTSIRAALVGM